MTNILLCTLGASWAVVPEIYGFISPDKLPLYRNHPNRAQLDALLRDYALQAADEIWVCTTQGAAIQQSIAQLRRWTGLLQDAPRLRIWQAGATEALSTQDECRHTQELIVRATLAAHERARGGQVVLSLAGGRKTMSADMQWAATVFGCQALLHVIGAEFAQMPETLKQADPELFTGPLDTRESAAISPLVTGRTHRSDLLDIRMDDREAVTAGRFPLPLPEPDRCIVWPAPQIWLEQELKDREKTGSRLLGNYFFELSRQEKHENWRSLYRLPPSRINRLRQTPLSGRHRDWLERLPKADLHRHLGGCLNLPEQRGVGRAVWDSLTPLQRSEALNAVRPLLDRQRWPADWPAFIKGHADKSHLAAALLTEADDAQLQRNLWDVTEPRVALKQRKGFSAYEQPGELSGSTLLCNAAAIPAYAACVVEQSVREGLAYVELRGSPQKYGHGLDFLGRFKDALEQALTGLPDGDRPLFRFIIIADRRRPGQLRQTIELAVQAKQRWPDFIVGLDMAGDEAAPSSLQQFGEWFLPVFEVCLPVTIHAGEGERAESIWQAVYHLHADRIGHGLTLNDNRELAERFRNRDICLELCPTSNVEVVGYRVPGRPHTADYPEYPLMSMWNRGLPLTLCTDNPGISRTTLSDEYLTAAAMTGRQLTQWNALAMLKQAFAHGFMAEKDKENLLKACDARIYQMLSDAAQTDPRNP